MKMRARKNKSIGLWLALVALILIALLFWLEYLGSEKPVTLKEIPVTAPADQAGLKN
jgi:ABC-type transporter Mla subunit MlaD